MPAGSEPVRPVSLPRTWRPFGVRLAGAVLGGGLLVVCAMTWFTFDQETRDKFTVFQRLTLLAIGVGVFMLFHALVRSRVLATDEHLVVVNGYRRHDYDYAQVVAVRFPPGAPWVTLDLADGTTVAAMGIQGSDGSRARQAVRELRTVVEDRSALA
ncbi:PH domain-containing protein [Nocardioides sp.]|uniref:PH domain-containing protein n=1 Tax=Nocardioides sp. TaxID=35761 RepID=UPI003783117D